MKLRRFGNYILPLVRQISRLKRTVERLYNTMRLCRERGCIVAKYNFHSSLLGAPLNWNINRLMIFFEWILISFRDAHFYNCVNFLWEFYRHVRNRKLYVGSVMFCVMYARFQNRPLFFVSVFNLFFSLFALYAPFFFFATMYEPLIHSFRSY